MTDSNLKATIIISNDLITSPLTVTPVLWLSNGAKYSLPPVNLDPSGTAIVDINQSLAAQGVAPYATLAGYVELDYQWPWPAICATIRSVDPVHSTIFTFFPGLALPAMVPARAIQPAPSASQPQPGGQAQPQTQTLEGLWWKQEPNVSAFVALSNPGQNAIAADLAVSDRQGNLISRHSAAVPAHGTKIIALNELQQISSSSGGLELAYQGPDNSLLVNAALRDDSSGYSASIPFVPAPPAPVADSSTPSSSTASYAELGLMTGAADPMLRFPPYTVFTPFSVARNISRQPVAVTPNLNWMSGSVPQTVQLPPVTLLPMQSQVFDVASFLSKAGLGEYNGSVNLILDVEGNAPSGNVLLASGSVDSKNTYVFQVTPQDDKESMAKNLSYWSTANGDDTMVTLWNPADEAQELVFKLHYIGGHYSFPIHLPARGTFMFNLSEITQNPAPDLEGNVIPAGTHEGSAELSGSQGEDQYILLSMDAGIYNQQKATCGPSCRTCQGAVDSWITDNPFATPLGTNHQLTFTIQNHSGTQINDTTIAGWNSSNAQVATVSSGVVLPVAPGSLYANAEDDTYPLNGTICSQFGTVCPFETGVVGSSGGNVTPFITSISPTWGTVGTNVGITIAGHAFGTAPTIVLSGTGLAVTYGSRSDTSISATFAIAPSAPVGIQNVQVQNNTTPDGSTPQSNAVSFQVVPAIATPVNFHVVSESNLPDGSLYFTYSWSSSTGNQTDLNACTVGESVYYPNYPSTPYIWPLPMVQSTTNPTAISGSATNAGFFDTNGPPDNYQTPYSAVSFSATQRFWWSCTNYNNGSLQTLYPDMTILRQTLQNGAWKYKINKQSYTNTVNLP
jgi:IPT/TIG domain